MSNVIIIGAGVAGLTAGIYARLADHEVTIYEQGSTPGGLSTSWKRKGYHFEGGLHWLCGTSPQLVDLHDIWRTVDAVGEEDDAEYSDPVFALRDGEGKLLPLWRDQRRLIAELAARSPKDRCRLRILGMDMTLFTAGFGPAKGICGTLSKILLMIPFGIRLVWLMGVSTRQYCNHFRDTGIRGLIGTVVSGEQNALSLIYTLAAYSSGASGYPKGGSLGMARRMEQRFLSLGGTLHYRSAVSRVVVEQGSAVGVVVNGETVRGDEVIVTSDTRRAIDEFFDTPIQDWWARRMRRGTCSEMCVFVCLGVHADLSHYPHAIRFRMKVDLPGHNPEGEYVRLTNYAPQHNPGYAPEGCSALTLLVDDDNHAFWQAAREEGSYAERKQRFVEQAIAAIAEVMPETAGCVEVTDMATPVTYRRYCQGYDGGYMGVWRAWHLPPLVPATCHRIKHLHFAGHRTELNGGIPVAARPGRKAARAARG